MASATSSADSRRVGQDLFEVRLTRELVARGIVTPVQLEEALRQQVILGGHLATNLWELRLADGKKLTELSADLLGVPVADPKAIASSPAEVRRVFPKDFVEESRLLPIRIVGSVLQVATCEPWDMLALGRAAFRGGYPIEPFFLAEVPLLALLEKLYGIPTSGRFWLGIEANERRRSQEEALPQFDLGGIGVQQPQKSALMSFVASEVEKLRGARRRDNDKRIIVQPLPPSALPPPEPPPAPLTTLAEARETLAQATDRDAVGRTLVRFALSRGRRVVLFARRESMWTGWLGAGDGVQDLRVRAISIPTIPDTFFGLVAQTGSYYLGPLVPHVAYAPLLLALGGQRPRSLAFLPVSVRGRLAFGIYFDNGPDTFVGNDVGDLLILAQGVATALDRLLKERRAAAKTQA